MRQLITIFLVTAATASLWAALANAGGPSILHMKNGNKITVEAYVDEGGHILYRRFGGDVRIPLTMVERIEPILPPQAASSPPEGRPDFKKIWEAERAKQQEPAKTIDPPAKPPVEGPAERDELDRWRDELARCPKLLHIFPNDDPSVRARKRHCQGLWEKIVAVEETMEMIQGKRPWPPPRR